MQEFRIQTSTFAPEFGRTPGGQISIVTRSGTNQFHGTASTTCGMMFLMPTTGSMDLPISVASQTGRTSERLRRHVQRSHTEKPDILLLLLRRPPVAAPKTSLSTVPDASFTPGTTNSRQNAVAAMQPFFNAFPLPNANSPEIYTLCTTSTDPTCPASGMQATGTAAFNATYSNRSTLDATSLRLDHRVNDKLTLFGRYNYAPSGTCSAREPIATWL